MQIVRMFMLLRAVVIITMITRTIRIIIMGMRIVTKWTICKSYHKRQSLSQLTIMTPKQCISRRRLLRVRIVKPT